MHLSLLLLKSQRMKKQIKINKNLQTNIEQRCKEQYQEIRKAQEGMETTQEVSESWLLSLQQIKLKGKRVYSQNFRVSGDTRTSDSGSDYKGRAGGWESEDLWKCNWPYIFMWGLQRFWETESHRKRAIAWQFWFQHFHSLC